MSFVFFVVFPIAFILYVALVFFGYSVGISKSWPGLGEYGAITSAIFVGVFVWMLATLVARIHLNASGITSKYLSWALFAVLYLVSGFGIANYLFYQWEGPTVLRQAIERAETDVTDLQNIAQSRLVPEEYGKMRDRVASNLSQLEAEIRNPQVCGVGSKAREAIADISKDLPSFRPFAVPPGSPSCTAPGVMDNLVKSYRNAATDQLEKAPLTLSLRIPDRQSLLANISLFSNGARNELGRLRGRVSSMSSQAHSDSTEFAEVLRALESIEGRYTNFRQQLASFLTLTADKPPPTFELTSARNVGSFTSTVDVIIQRVLRREGHFANILYLLIPFFLDLLIVLLILAVLRRPSIYQTERARYGDDIRYLLPPIPKRVRPASRT